MPLFTQRRGIDFLGSSHAGSCIAHPDTPEIASLDTPLRYAPLELVTPMDTYAR